jgi:hypothetical protein
VVLGSYFAVGGRQGVLRWQASLQDAKRGETLTTLTETGSEGTLLELVSRAAARLRERLGGKRRLSPAVKRRVRAVLPPMPVFSRKGPGLFRSIPPGSVA